MNGNAHMEVHYLNTGFAYSAAESFMGFFEGIAHMPASYTHAGTVHDQENAFWSMNMNAYKLGFSGPASAHYSPYYEVNGNMSRIDMDGRAWEYPSPSVANVEESTTRDMPSNGDINMGVSNHSSSSNHQVQGVWEDEIDLNNMTYEQLLELGETVGTQSRGLSQELISLLPTSKCKFGSFFLRKKHGERCVICQMRYKRGDKQTKLPCKHVYHSECISKWLGINKVCPVCNNEVFVEESRP
uniref:E3 ubiquitin ligase BIG BROTHER isoform X2 n=1 Tax=Rhizophora mucronata TaxID=61149 RepID=A0A2P2JLM5_RHIMU